jgi:integrase/recombinase XerC
MQRTNGERIHEPHKHGNRWRVGVVLARGRGERRQTVYRSFATRALADAFVAGARGEAEGATVRAAVDTYLEHLRGAGRAQSTLETMEHRLWHLLGLPANADRPVRWLLNRGDELYQAAQPGRSASTHRGELAAAKTLGKFLVSKRWLRLNPFADVVPVGRARRGNEKPQLRVDEARRLTDTCLRRGDDAAMAVLTALLVGMRAGEVVGLNVRDVDDGGRLVWVAAAKTVAGVRCNEVPDVLRPRLVALAAGRGGDAPLFTDREGGRPTRDWLHYYADTLCRAAGVPEVGPHGLRRTHASLATKGGATGHLVAAQLGHASPVVTHAAYIDPLAASSARTARTVDVITGPRDPRGSDRGSN